MEKIYATILSLIISCFVTYSLIVPTSHIFGLEDSTAVNSLVDASDPLQSATITEQKSKDNPQEVETTTSEPQKVDDPNSEQGSSEQSGQNKKASLSDERISPSKSPAQTAKAFSSADATLPGRVGMVTVKVVSANQIDLKWAGVKDSDLNHYNVYLGTKSSFKVSPDVTVPTGTSSTNSYSSTGLKPSTNYYYKIAAVDNAGNIGPFSNTKSGITEDAATLTQKNDSPTQDLRGLSSSPTLSTSSVDTSPPAQVTGLIIRTLSSTQLYLSWSRVTASDFNHYNIYRGTSGFTVTPGVTVPTGTSTTSILTQDLIHLPHTTTELLLWITLEI